MTSAQAHAATAAPAAHAGRPPALARGWSVATLAGAILSAFIASACCVGPLLLALLGLGGGALLVKFEPYRPYFATATLALLGTGFWLQYRKPSRAAAMAQAAPCDCPAPRTRRIGRVMLWIATALVVGFLAFPYVAPLIWG